jgi:hypothetical protein
MGTGNGGINEIIPWYRQKATWTAIAAFFTALGAYIEGSLGLTGLVSAGFAAASVIFIRQGVEKSTYIPELKDRGEEILE